MPPKPVHKPPASIREIIGKRRPTRWEQLLLGVDGKKSPRPRLRWSSIGSLSRPRWGASAFALQQTIWVVGGHHEDGSVAGIEVLDPATDGWSTIAYPFTAFGQAFVTTPNGMLFAVGGLQSCQSLVASVEEYNPSTGTVTPKAPVPTASYAPGIASTADGKIYVMGGCLPPSVDPGGPPAAILTAVQIYDQQTNTWSSGASMPVPRYQFPAVAAPNGKIYAIGGTDGATELNRVDVYDPQTNAWTQAAPMPTARRCLAAALAFNNTIYTLGGLSGTASLATVEIYDLAGNTWTSGASLGVGRWYLAAAALGSSIYSCGGYERIGPYQPDNANVNALATVEQSSIP